MPAPKGHPPYNKNGEGGRPAIKWPPERLEELADRFEEWMKRPDSIWYEQFCLENDFLPEQLTRFAEKSERFGQVYKKSQAWQKTKLIKGGLINEFNAGFTKFVMSNTCGWTDKQQVSGDATNPIGFLLKRADGQSQELVDGQ